jgi:hypothetical protein
MGNGQEVFLMSELEAQVLTTLLRHLRNGCNSAHELGRMAVIFILTGTLEHTIPPRRMKWLVGLELLWTRFWGTAFSVQQ